VLAKGLGKPGADKLGAIRLATLLYLFGNLFRSLFGHMSIIYDHGKIRSAGCVIVRFRWWCLYARLNGCLHHKGKWETSS
jgi:hypothetical protein